MMAKIIVQNGRYLCRGALWGLVLAGWFLGIRAPRADAAEPGAEAEALEQMLAQPSKHFENYRFDPASNVTERIYEVPEFIIKPLRVHDRRKDYTPYTPTNGELMLLAAYLDLLPPVNQQLIQERVVAIFFVNNLLGGGMTDWVLDVEGKPYFYILINSNALKESLATFLTKKELTCFKINDPSIKIAVDSGSKFRGLLYVLMHESVHVVDYVRGLTPYPDPWFGRAMGKSGNPTEFTKGFWRTYRETVTPYDPRITEDVTFYSLDGGPKLNITEAPSIYDRLSTMPYISLYATLSWAEDLADTVTFYHLTKRLELPYRIHLFRNDHRIAEHLPAQKTPIRDRYFPLEAFYGERAGGN
jgi:hypothetical protein